VVTPCWNGGLSLWLQNEWMWCLREWEASVASRVWMRWWCIYRVSHRRNGTEDCDSRSDERWTASFGRSRRLGS
jgi:hypothetical protein